MELTAGYPFSLINNGLPFHYPKLQSDKKSDVVIIGGGISGAISAYLLSREGISCVLVDKRTIGLGSTCASTSLVQYELDTPLHILTEKLGAEKANRIYKISGEAVDKILVLMKETGFNPYSTNQSLFFSTRKKEKEFMQRELMARKKAGFEVDWFGSRELRELMGLRAEFGILSRKGATMDAYLFTHHLLQKAMQLGLQVFDRTSVKSIHRNPKTIIVRMEEDNEISTQFVINATGYEVINFIDKRIVDFDCTYAIASEHQSERGPLWKDGMMLWNTDSPYLYMRLSNDNRLFAGGHDEPFSNKTTRQLFLEKKSKSIEADVKTILPQLEFRTEFVWSGTFGKTPDSLPYIGTLPGQPRIYYALGFGGNGITFSLVAAEMILDHILQRKNKDIALFSFER